MSYSSVVLTDTPVSYWRLDETAGATTVADSGSGAVTGSVATGITLGASGLLTGDANTAASCAASVGTENIDFGANYAFTGTAAFSVEFWINPTATAITNSAFILSRRDTTDGWVIKIQTNFIQFIRRVSSVEVAVSGAGSSIAAGNVYHVVCTYDGTNGRIYLNGAQSGSTGASDTRSLVTPIVNMFACKFSGGGNRYDGILDEIAVYNSALSLARIQAHYTAGTTNPASGFSNTVPPSLSGGLSIGGTLTINPGTWTPTPGSYTYAWDRADDTSGLNLARITTATGATYTLDAADAAKYIRAGVYPAA